MTLQQLKYVIAVNEHRNFAKAAEACSVTQPTLSAMLMKLEDELGTRIFERTNKNVVPTPTGEKIIDLAEQTLANADRIHDVIDAENASVSGEIKISVAPTVAPYIMPDFISRYTRQFPLVKLAIKDMKSASVLNALLDGSIDAGIGLAGNTRKGIREIPIYTEKIEIYRSPKQLEDGTGFLWVLKEALSLRESTFSLFEKEETRHIYEATSIDQLVRLVDREGGFTMIPHMHLRFLTNEQRQNIVERSPDEPLTQRKISLYLRSGDTRHNAQQSIVSILKLIIPPAMIEPSFLSFEIV